VSQPNAFSGGQTAVTPRSDVEVQSEVPRVFHWTEGASLQSIVDTINGIGASPDDLMAILQALSEAGALSGELVVICCCPSTFLPSPFPPRSPRRMPQATPPRPRRPPTRAWSR